MKVLLYGRYGQYPKDLENLVKKFRFEILPNPPQPSHPPEIVITYGGDGTFLGAERDYPEIPKLLLRNSHTCRLCSALPTEKLLEMLKNNNLKEKYLTKLEINLGEKTLYAINDVVIRNTLLNSALRFKISGNDETLIGDGLVIATPLGSTGYYYSITKKPFSEGISIAFNNIHTPQIPHISQTINSEITINIIRGPGQLSVDNNPGILTLCDGNFIKINEAPQKATILIP